MYPWLVALLLLIAHGTALAQSGKTAWEELGNRLKASQEVSALGPNLFGDQVSLSNGALSFSATDLSIPGNNSLPVAFSRSYRVRDWRYRVTDGMLKDWDVELPNISSVGFDDWEDSNGNQQRCSVGGPSPSPTSGLHPIDYWQGTNLDIPGVSSGELLRTIAGTATPGSGYLWMTNDQVHISCLSSIKNGDGQGFLAIAPDGTKYWFDWMARHTEPDLKHVDAIVNPGGDPFIQYRDRYRHVLYVTRVEDRFGNYVEYIYDNSDNSDKKPGKLIEITASDGRSITINYSGSGNTISSISDGTRTWSYAYGSANSGRGTLTSVTQPDGKVWSINFAAFTNAEIQTLEYTPSGEELRSCWLLELPQNYDSEPVATMTHPSGATGSFRLFIAEHGRSNVPLNCRNVTTWVGYPNGTGNNRNDDTPLFPISAYAFTLKSKSISGVGMDTLHWLYEYEPNIGFEEERGATRQYPVCTLGTSECQEPICTDDGCAGSSVTTVTGPDGEWVRHRYGNSFKYNEGKLVSVEVGSGSTTSAPLRKTTHSYDLMMTDGAYKARWGTGYRAYGDSFQSEYHRPLVKRVVEQDGGLFVWEVPTGCSTSYPASYCLDSLARPVRVVRSGTVATSPTDENPVVPPGHAPTLTVPASSTTGNYSASWTSVATASSYQLQERLGAGSWSTIHDGSATSKAISGKITGNWNYQVRACNAVGCGPWSASATTVVNLPPPPPPGAPTVTAPASNTSGSYTVTWTSPSGATSYKLEHRKNEGNWGPLYIGTATSRAITVPTVGTYSYRVMACNDGGCSDFSAASSTVVSPGAPTLTAPATNSTGSYTVSWTSVALASSYQLQERLGTASWSTIHSASATSKAVSGKSTGSWSYQVRACDGAVCGAWSAIDTTIVTLAPPPIPDPPTLTAPATNTTGSYTVSWTSPSGATRYELDQRKDGGAWANVHNASSTSKAITVSAVGTYGYRVKACNDNGCSAYSPTANTVVSLAVPVLTAPASSSTGNYTVNWTSVALASSYQLQERLGSGSWSTIHNASGTSKAISGKTTGSWSYQVRACEASTCSGWSAIDTTVVTLVSNPPTGTPIVTAPATANLATGFTVSWTNIAGATQYILARSRNGGAFSTVYDGPATSTVQTLGLLGTYRYRVKACNSNGCGPLSGTRIVTVSGGGMNLNRVSESEAMATPQADGELIAASEESIDSGSDNREAAE